VSAAGGPDRTASPPADGDARIARTTYIHALPSWQTRARELPEYLAHRLRLAACELPLFDPPAIDAIFQATQALPRKVNRLAHYALTAAAIAKAIAVTVERVQAALTEAG